MRVLVACEFSGTVREAFRTLGHDAWSCDLLPTSAPGPHYQCDVREILNEGWDLLIAHPPCTDLSVSGARWFPAKRANGAQQRSIDFFMLFATTTIPRVAIENPVGIMSTVYRKPSQIIHPWQFGHPEFKTTCLWLTGLPLLAATNVLEKPTRLDPDWKAWNRVHKCPPGPDRKFLRSWRYPGIAAAMAAQWGAQP